MTEIGKVRNVEILSHGGFGKTSLAEALVFTTKASTRLGKVGDAKNVRNGEKE